MENKEQETLALVANNKTKKWSWESYCIWCHHPEVWRHSQNRWHSSAALCSSCHTWWWCILQRRRKNRVFFYNFYNIQEGHMTAWWGGWERTGSKLGPRWDVQVRMYKTNVAADEPDKTPTWFHWAGWLHEKVWAVVNLPVRPRYRREEDGHNISAKEEVRVCCFSPVSRSTTYHRSCFFPARAPKQSEADYGICVGLHVAYHLTEAKHHTKTFWHFNPSTSFADNDLPFHCSLS